MEDGPIPPALRQVRDLRDVDQALYCSGLQWPEPVPDDALGGSSGFNAVVLVLRSILLRVPAAIRPAEDGEAEAENPILPFAFTHFPGDGELDIATAKPYLERIRERVSPAGLSFFDIMEGDKMKATFWKSEIFHLTSREILTRKIGDIPFVVRHRQDELSREADRSLVHWDGSKPLGEHLSGLFGFCKNETTGVELFTTPNLPIVLRILVKPSGDADAPALTYDSIRHAAMECFFTKDKGATFLRKSPPRQYVPFAVVRLRRSEDSRDYVRLYDDFGHNLLPADFKDNSREYLQYSWRFGQAGYSYMVYMVAVHKKPPKSYWSSERPPEIMRFSADQLKRMTALNKAAAAPTILAARPNTQDSGKRPKTQSPTADEDQGLHSEQGARDTHRPSKRRRRGRRNHVAVPTGDRAADGRPRGERAADGRPPGERAADGRPRPGNSQDGRRHGDHYRPPRRDDRSPEPYRQREDRGGRRVSRSPPRRSRSRSNGHRHDRNRDRSRDHSGDRRSDHRSDRRSDRHYDRSPSRHRHRDRDNRRSPRSR